MNILRDICADEHNLGTCSLGVSGIYSADVGKGVLEGGECEGH